MNNNDKKQENVNTMIKTLLSICKNMDSSKLKSEYKKLLFYILSNISDLNKILIYIDNQIVKYTCVSNSIVGLRNEDIVVFWKKIQNIITDVYFKNKKLDEYK